MGLVERLVPETSLEEWQQAIKLAQAYLHTLGITAIQDAMPSCRRRSTPTERWRIAAS